MCYQRRINTGQDFRGPAGISDLVTVRAYARTQISTTDADDFSNRRHSIPQ